jgi:hypothetical protein
MHRYHVACPARDPPVLTSLRNMNTISFSLSTRTPASNQNFFISLILSRLHQDVVHSLSASSKYQGVRDMYIASCLSRISRASGFVISSIHHPYMRGSKNYYNSSERLFMRSRKKKERKTQCVEKLVRS